MASKAAIMMTSTSSSLPTTTAHPPLLRNQNEGAAAAPDAEQRLLSGMLSRGQPREEGASEGGTDLSSPSSSSSFSVVEYLNVALALGPPGGGTTTNSPQLQQRQQQKMAELALQLQMETSHCHESIGRISAELQAIVPRIASDVSRLGAGLSGLQLDARSLLSRSAVATNDDDDEAALAATKTAAPPSVVDGEEGTREETTTATTTTTTSLETLSKLHGLQAGLLHTKDILTAVSAWDETLRSIPSLLAQNQLERAVQALVLLQGYQQRLREMPNGNKDRQEQHDKVRGQVMDLLGPVLQNAVSALLASNGRVVQPLQQCVHMYARLGALPVLQGEYVKTRPNHVHKLWFQFDPARDQLATWIPTWLDAVYQLVGEEIRQASAVFGGGSASAGAAAGTNAASPTVPIAMTIRVLHECFRPLKASWSSRLEALCSSNSSNSNNNTATAGAGGAHDWEGLCSVYESILQFLSMVYGTVVGTYQDLQESGALLVAQKRLHGPAGSGVAGDNALVDAIMSPEHLYRELANAFVVVASPFAAFQEKFGALETAHSSRYAHQILGDMKAVLVRAANRDDDDGDHGDDTGPGNPAPIEDLFPPRSITVEGLTRAVDGLVKECTRIFDVAEGALERYELLRGGYDVVELALRPVDAVVAAHVDELASLVSMLTRLTRESLLLVSSGAGDAAHSHLDESVVTASLQVLHVAGTVVRRFDDFAGRHARQRLAVWTERLTAQLDRSPSTELSGANAVGPASARSFTLPDSMSPVDVDSIVAQSVAVAVVRQDASTALSILQTVTSSEPSSSESTVSLFPLIEASVARLCRACQIQVFETCSTVPLLHLAGMSSLPCWRAGSSASSAGGVSSEYGTLPQSYMTQVGEHMLSLVQALEPFASNMDALALAGPVMSGVRQVAVAPWREFVQATESTIVAEDDDLVLMQLMDGASYSALRKGQNETSDDVQHDEAASGSMSLDPNDDASHADSGAVTAFCNAWLDAVGCAVTGRLLERILHIASLSPRGCEHLHADVTYLANVLTALDVAGHPHPLLVHASEWAIADGAELSERIARQEEVVGDTSLSDTVFLATEQRLGAIRGVAARYNY